jgi:hypothetical protein
MEIESKQASTRKAGSATEKRQTETKARKEIRKEGRKKGRKETLTR